MPVETKLLENVAITGTNNKITRMTVRVRQDGVILAAGNPLFVGDDFTEAGLPAPKVNQKWEDYSSEEQALALTIDHPRVEWKEKPEIRAWLNGEIVEEDTRERQNEFLRSKGFRWAKRGIYHSGDGDMVDRWFLLNPEGQAVVGYKDGGFDLIPFGSVKDILTGLGYYGQAAIDQAEAEEKASAERREMHEKVDAYFNDDANRVDDGEPNFTTRPIQIESFMPRRQFYIEPDGIWLDVYNSADGDDWSRNNTDYGIASKYRYDAEIVNCLEVLKK